jgi:cob(I)alamin adenosyltransferase
MTIISKKGDQGKSYWLGKAISKDDLLLETVGTIDELQCTLGIAKAEIEYGFLRTQIDDIQKDLWSIAGRLAGYNKSKGVKLVNLENRIKDMEIEIKEWEKELPTVRNFMLPGVNKKEALLQLSRSMIRRVERRLVSLSKRDKVDVKILPYFNRLSDYLFMLANQVAK